MIYYILTLLKYRFICLHTKWSQLPKVVVGYINLSCAAIKLI